MNLVKRIRKRQVDGKYTFLKTLMLFIKWLEVQALNVSLNCFECPSLLWQNHVEFFLDRRSLVIWNSKTHQQADFFLLNHKSCMARLKTSIYDFVNIFSDNRRLLIAIHDVFPMTGSKTAAKPVFLDRLRIQQLLCYQNSQSFVTKDQIKNCQTPKKYKIPRN